VGSLLFDLVSQTRYSSNTLVLWGVLLNKKNIKQLPEMIIPAILCLIMVISSCSPPTHTGDIRNKNTVSETNKNPTPSSQHLEKDGLLPILFEGQLCHWVREIFEDSKGNLWFGTNHYGIMLYDGDRLSYINEKYGIPDGRINGIIEDAEGKIWIATYAGLSVYNEQKVTTYTKEDGLISDDIWSIMFDDSGKLWIGTVDGVSVFDGQAFRDFDIPDIAVKDTTTILSYDRITAIMQDSNGNIWFGRDGFGLSIYDGVGFEHINKSNGLSDNGISSLLEANNGSIWVGTMSGGVSIIQGDSIHNLLEEGLISGQEVSDFFQDSSDNIWFGIEHGGIYQYNGTGYKNFSRDDGLITEGIISMLQDSEGRFWFGGFGGLFRFFPREELNQDEFIPITKNGPWN